MIRFLYQQQQFSEAGHMIQNNAVRASTNSIRTSFSP